MDNPVDKAVDDMSNAIDALVDAIDDYIEAVHQDHINEDIGRSLRRRLLRDDLAEAIRRVVQPPEEGSS